MEDLTVLVTQVKVFINGDLSRSAEVGFHPKMRYRDFVDVCKEKLMVSLEARCRLFDSTGDEYSDDDMEYVDTGEPLFLSLGEDFMRNLSLSVYELIRPLGEGGFGQVRLYRHRLNKSKVAIKFVDTSMKSTEEVTQTFSEMNLLRGLHHPNIVSLLETFILQDSLCIVMEYCRGGELKAALREAGHMEEEKVYSIGTQLIEAIRYCHNANVVHRDLKLENILFADKSRITIKVVDFGIAGVFKAGRRGERSDAGSLLYIAPEVFSGRDNSAAPALDIWSIGCIFYFLLVGFHPFTGPSIKAMVDNATNGRFPPLPARLSAPWHCLIKGLLQVDPDRRWNMLRISEHLRKHRENPELCPDCLYNIEEAKASVEPVDSPVAPRMARRSIAGTLDFKRTDAKVRFGGSPVKGKPTQKAPRKSITSIAEIRKI